MLRPLRDQFPAEEYPQLLAGLAQPDDAALWQLDEERVLVFTTDFFTPVVDDPFDYGAIAAANSLSDVYAMGGEPFLALNIAALPPQLDSQIGTEIFRGAAEVARGAGVVIAGGHTVQDKEPKFGLAVVGMARSGQVFSKAGAQEGDVLVLTKPLGMGVTTTALKRDLAAAEDVREAVTWMKQTNRAASRLALWFGVRAATDITGFGLLGHVQEMAAQASVRFELDWESLPFLSGAAGYAEQWIFPGGASDNKRFFERDVVFSDSLSDPRRMLLFDPQTSGGLLLCLPPAQAAGFLAAAQAENLPVWQVGRVRAGAGVAVHTRDDS